MLTTELVERILATIPLRTVGLLGDLFLDRYLDVDPARDEPSVETGLTAYQVTGVRSYPGALGTVLNNLAALGIGRITPISVIGDDGEGYELQQALRKIPAVDMGGLVTTADRRTPTYTKPMYGTKELNRLDIKNRTPTPASLEDAILKLLDERWSQFDALIVLDQVSEVDCGVVTKRVREWLAERGEKEPNKFILADSREQIGLFRNVCLKPNFAEWKSASKAMEKFQGFVFLTQGVQGTVVLDADGKSGSHSACLIPAYPVAGPIDICGAGDSCSAGIASAMVSGATHEEAAAFGNLIASITIQQIGVTGTATPEQVRARWREVQ